MQVDDPALREGLPLKTEQWASYLEWAVDSFRITCAVASNETQIVTHLCYSQFEDILPAIDRLDGMHRPPISAVRGYLFYNQNGSKRGNPQSNNESRVHYFSSRASLQ